MQLISKKLLNSPVMPCDYFGTIKNGGLFLSGEDSEQLIMRSKSAYDGAIPSANSVFAMDCLKLSGLTGNPEYEKTAMEIFCTFGKELETQPAAYSFLATAFLYFTAKTADIVIACDNPEDGEEMLRALRSAYRPLVRTLLKLQGDATLLETAPVFGGLSLVERTKPPPICVLVATCRPPVTDSKKLIFAPRFTCDLINKQIWKCADLLLSFSCFHLFLISQWT